MQKNQEFAEKAIADWEEVKKTLFWSEFCKEINRLIAMSMKNASIENDVEEILRHQGEYRAFERLTRVPQDIIKRLRDKGIPDDELVGPDLK